MDISSHVREELDNPAPESPDTYTLEEHNTVIPDEHSMGKTLREYIYQRIHQEIKRPEWQTIRVTDSLQRDPPAIISSWEIKKQPTPFNFRRPTATIIDDSTLEIHCFPCPAFVRHYSRVISTYLQFENRATKVETLIPTDLVSENVLRQSNLSELGATDVVIFGEVHRLTQLVSGITWGSQHPNGLFAWHTFESEGGKSITLLGCRESLWGEAAGSLVRILREFSKIQCLIYVSKVGSLAENVSANERIATGCRSTFEDEDKDITWDDPLRDIKLIALSDLVLRGRLVSVPSPLCETKEWLGQWQETCAWVDCETWHMAQAAKDVKVKFGYLHIVSDNLAEENGENLSNEDCNGIQSKREKLFREIEIILRQFIKTWDTQNAINTIVTEST
ncbi:hypothetical protein HER10_EVM0004020 [Colletotrichum scovillei]|uniref:uncharacterized protein n=1 Tax=Colletotrichum scovillei TaxID=1209932 RepID=UPI0015C32165|nr:uncharacterized protein HER10_EVM0004020 [Colletotrichum scovillei]KAF4773741.1 hypothetical protein HER10_EVM0004020 [Colletotrichum scovillei]